MHAKKKDPNPNKQKIKRSLDLPPALTSPSKGFLPVSRPSLRRVPSTSRSVLPPALGRGGAAGDDLQHFLIKLIYVGKFQMSTPYSAKPVGERGTCAWAASLPACPAGWCVGARGREEETWPSRLSER